MTDYTVAIIGAGPDPDGSSHDGYSMGHRHANAYRTIDGCALEACVDIVPEHADAFVDAFAISSDRAYTDHRRMLDEVRPDIVSVCTPPATHADIVEDCARHDAVRAIHCEKPMAVTYGESRHIRDVCENGDVQLTINLQNRCSGVVREAKRLIDDGEIGDVNRIELGRHDFLQTGIHHVDLANFLLDDDPIQWAFGQVDCSEAKRWYTDMHVETSGLGLWRYASGVHGLAAVGDVRDAIGPHTNRVLGTEGDIEIDLGFHECRIRTHDSPTWQEIDAPDPNPQENAITEVVDGLRSGEAPPISGDVGLAATELVFGIWESARQRRRIEFPLEIDDNPLESLIETNS